MVQALNGTKGSVSTSARAVGTETKQVATGANAQKGTAQTAGKAVGTAVKTGLDSTKSSVKSAGTAVGKAGGEGVKSGADGQKGSAKSAGQSLGNALADGIKSKNSTAKSAGSSFPVLEKDFREARSMLDTAKGASLAELMKPGNSTIGKPRFNLCAVGGRNLAAKRFRRIRFPKMRFSKTSRQALR